MFVEAFHAHDATVSSTSDTHASHVRRRNQRAARSFVWGGVFIASAGLGLVTIRGDRLPASEPSEPVAAQFVGSNACLSCHIAEAGRWNQSQHRASMAVATETSVLGDFHDARFTYAGVTSEFFTRAGKFYVRTDGADGKLADFEIKYTFGVFPLQQYLIAFADGRIQALSIAWDARSQEDGGQRWFHLYPNERVTHDDELHWTRPAQNWNSMCADCHATAVRKNYNATADHFDTHWTESGVGCEACHGPGSRHVAWANEPRTAGTPKDLTMGLTTRLDERRGVRWIVNTKTGNAARSLPRRSEREIDVCAQCHSRRTQLSDGYEAGKPLLDYYRPALLTAPLYYADGQQHGEVYTWGSFLQSRMHAQGVTCSDCHDPHSGQLRADGNAVCAGCHSAAKYDTPEHHHHEKGSTGAACAACHMPPTTYMVIDPRHDHSLRVPRPDLSITLGTPNACTTCHDARGARWAAARVAEWYGPDRPADRYGHAASVFAAAADNSRAAQAQLRALVRDTTEPMITRATLLTELNPNVDAPAAVSTLIEGLHDNAAVMRLGAVQSVVQLPPEWRLHLAAHLLSDSARALRIEAIGILATAPADQVSPLQSAAFDRAAEDFITAQRYNSDRADARTNLGTFMAQRGTVARAEEELTAAIRLDPFFAPAYINLADLYRARGRDADGERILRQGLARAPRSAVLHHALGLALVRLKRQREALVELERASTLEPTDARFAYIYAVALQSSGKTAAAIAKLEAALQTHPNDADILGALVNFNEEKGDKTKAQQYAEKLHALSAQR